MSPQHPSAKPGEVWLSLKDAGSDKGRPDSLTTSWLLLPGAGACQRVLGSTLKTSPSLPEFVLKLPYEVEVLHEEEGEAKCLSSVRCLGRHCSLES